MQREEKREPRARTVPKGEENEPDGKRRGVGGEETKSTRGEEGAENAH